MFRFLLTGLLCLTLAPAQASPLASIDVPIYAASLIGTPYQWGGNTPEQGFDCSGLVDHVFSQVMGVDLPRSSRELSTVGVEVERDALEPGDLVFFNTRDEPYTHVGIYVGDARFVHASGSRSGIMLSGLDEPYWHDRYDGARRVTAAP